MTYNDLNLTFLHDSKTRPFSFPSYRHMIVYKFVAHSDSVVSVLRLLTAQVLSSQPWLKLILHPNANEKYSYVCIYNEELDMPYVYKQSSNAHTGKLP